MENRTMKQKSLLLLLAAALVLFTGCGTIIPTDEAPVIEDAVQDVSVLAGDSITLTLEHVDVYDVNGDQMTLVVVDGDNYTVIGNTVIPDDGFAGDLHVVIKVKDETGKESSTKTIIISVLPDFEEIFPLFTGATWMFSDTFHTINETATSKLEVTGEYTEPLAGVTGEVFKMEWADTLSHAYLFQSDTTGMTQVGGVAATDTFVDPQMMLRYPVSVNDNWVYSPLQYSLDAFRFFRDSSVNGMTCIAVDEYVTVPAGTFKCVVYQYAFPYTKTTRGASVEDILLPTGESIKVSLPASRNTVNVTVQLSYAAGVGYIQNRTLINGQLVTRKVLTSYIVEEK